MMKKIFLLLFSAVALLSCEGPQGPPGFDGVNFVGQSFEVTVDFDAFNNYEVIVPYSPRVDVFPTDMTLVYILFDEVPDNNGNTIDVWRLIPQTLYASFGEYQYNYDATNSDVRLFMDSPVFSDLDLLRPADLTNQTFRVVILPVELANMPGIDFTDYNSVMQLGGIETDDIIVVE